MRSASDHHSMPPVPPSSVLRRSTIRIAAGIAATVAAIGLGAGVASAHIDPDPPTVPAGEHVSVGFGVEHGCDGSNTTQLAFQIPAGVTDAEPVQRPGWTTNVAGDTVTFAGGNLDAATEQTFQLTFTAPSSPGTLRFPIIQTCAVGELAWIEETPASGAEPEHPAPEVEVVGSGSSTPATTPATVPAAVDTSASATVSVALPSSDSDSDSSGHTGLVIALVAAAVVVIACAVLVARRRSDRRRDVPFG
jgi:uncharacterized protein YcnI